MEGLVARSPAEAGLREWFILALLALGFVLSFVDRQVLSLLVPPIKLDLALSDTQIGLLHGVAFAIFYTLLGVPLALLADRGYRVGLIVIGMLGWSAATIGCGLVGSFAGLFFCRILVGVGEAALNPAAYGLIGDHFPAHLRGRAYGIFHIAASIGGGAALIAGGGLIAALGSDGPVSMPIVGLVAPWQAVFILCGLPGIPLAAVIFFSMRRLQGKAFPKPNMTSGSDAGTAMLGSEILRFLPLFLGSSAFAAFGVGVLAWAPTFFVRTFEWSMTTTGLALGGVILLAGTVGPFAGGWMADHLGGGEVGPKRTIRYLAIAAFFPGVMAFLVDDARLALLLYGLSYGFFTAHVGLVPAIIQASANTNTRARLSAIWLCLFNMIGIGAGPLIVALLTDRMLEDPSRIGISMSITALLALGSALLLMIGLSKSRSLTV